MPEVRYSNLLIGGKCMVYACKNPVFRRAMCRPCYAKWKLGTDERILEKARVHGVDCFVYAIRAENGLIKIGVSIQPERRIMALRSSSPTPLELLGYIPGSFGIENMLHKLLSDSSSHGEWFYPTPEVLEAVDAIVSKDLNQLEAVLT